MEVWVSRPPASSSRTSSAGWSSQHARSSRASRRRLGCGRSSPAAKIEFSRGAINYQSAAATATAGDTYNDEPGRPCSRPSDTNAGWDAQARYCVSKLLGYMLLWELFDRVAADDVVVNHRGPGLRPSHEALPHH
ncbi:hypothetical protein BX600DRAFT_437717 [Xylariales sp. PMI_506]|nr:hypothetical protein BX600DRAFT_437717 [Xylariales sp. PMI_506]